MLKSVTTLSALTVALLVAFSVPAEDKAPAAKEIKDPKAAAEEKPKFHLSQPIVKELRAIDNFIYGEAESSFETMMDDLQKTFFPLMEKNGKDGIVYDYPPIFVYQGVKADADPKAKFKLQTGYPAREDTKAVAPFKTRQLEGHRCVSVYYTGPLMQMEAAYKAIFAEIAKAGHKPTGEMRELYLYWEGEDSPNTVVELQVSIAKVGDNKDEKKAPK